MHRSGSPWRVRRRGNSGTLMRVRGMVEESSAERSKRHGERGSDRMTDLGELEREWRTSERWTGIVRPYGPEDVERLRGSVRIQHTLAELGSERLWHLLQTEER